MKKPFIFALFAMLLCGPILAQGSAVKDHRDWEDPQIIGINKLPYHSTLMLPSKQKECKEIHSLDGEWKFCWSKDPWSRPESFYKEDYDASGWATIKVPGNWQLQGFGRPIYSNIPFPFKADQPRVTSEPPRDWFAFENSPPISILIPFLYWIRKATKQSISTTTSA